MTERTDLLKDPRFATLRGRWEHHYEIAPILREEFSKKPRASWLKALDANGVANAPIYDISEVFQDPQIKHLGVLQEIHHSKMGSSTLVGNAVKLSDTPPQFIRPAPLLGEDTDEILAHLAYDKESIQSLRARGVI